MDGRRARFIKEPSALPSATYLRSFLCAPPNVKPLWRRVSIPGPLGQCGSRRGGSQAAGQHQKPEVRAVGGRGRHPQPSSLHLHGARSNKQQSEAIRSNQHTPAAELPPRSREAAGNGVLDEEHPARPVQQREAV